MQRMQLSTSKGMALVESCKHTNTWLSKGETFHCNTSGSQLWSRESDRQPKNSPEIYLVLAVGVLPPATEMNTEARELRRKLRWREVKRHLLLKWG